MSESSARVSSIDALRGFVMLAMLFVNDVAGVNGTPSWMKHYPTAGRNFGMTFVDVVFGSFLFIVGMSIPLALGRKVDRGEPVWKVGLHLLTRSAALIMLGLFMMNEEVGAQQPHWRAGLWGLIMSICAIVAFISPPREGSLRKIVIALRAIAFVALAYLWIVFRGPDGKGMRPEWWGILGLIGWAYLVASILYLPLRRYRAALVGAMALLLAVFICDNAGGFHRLWIKNNLIGDIATVLGSQPSIAMAGAILTSNILDQTFATRRRRIGAVLLFAAMCAVGAVLFNPMYHISKNDATPSWCLWCCAITAVLWLIFSLAIDATGERVWWFLIRGGENALLAYLLAHVWESILVTTNSEFYWRWGDEVFRYGVWRSITASIVILGIAAFLKDRGVRLRL